MVEARARRCSKVVAALITVAAAGAGLAVSAPARAAAPRAGSLTVSLKWAELLGSNSEIDLSSPNIATLDGAGNSIVVGSRVNGCVYAVHLATGSTTPGWPQCTGTAVDSTPAVLPAAGGLDDVVVTTGDVSGMNPAALAAGSGFIVEYGPAGTTQWVRTLPDVHGAFRGAPRHPGVARHRRHRHRADAHRRGRREPEPVLARPVVGRDGGGLAPGDRRHHLRHRGHRQRQRGSADHRRQ